MDKDRNDLKKLNIKSINRDKLKSVKLAISTTFNAESIEKYLIGWGKKFGYDMDVVFTNNNQVFQELSDENSLITSNKGINVLLIRFEDWILGDNSSDLKKVGKLEGHFKDLIKIFKNKPKPAPYFVGIFPVSTYLSLSTDLIEYLEEMYDRWQKILEDLHNVYIIDFTRLQEHFIFEKVFDTETDQNNHLPFSREYCAVMGTIIARKIVAYIKNPFKVIVLDCDNTLWKGIVGEDGPIGIKVEGPFKQLQQFMIQKYNEGFLLALCSKNNEPDVWEAFEKNPGMMLKKEHLTHWKINWGTKSSNMEEMARELNLGIDSFVFIDDNPVECAEVMTNSPKILSLRLPEETASILRWLQHVWAFDKITVTEEDKKRNDMYRAEKKRVDLQQKSQSLIDFLENLGLKISMNKMKPHQAARVSQLTQRTNQFNLSSIHRKEDDILKLEKEPGTIIWVLEVSDKFGDYGLVGVVITKEKEQSLFIDTLLLSCRSLGRGAELAILAGLRKHCEEKNLKSLVASYYPTAKNKPLLEFLEERWIKEQDHKDHKVFVYLFDKLSESIDFVDFYYMKDFEQEFVSTRKEVYHRSTPGTDKKETSDDSPGKMVETQWKVEKVNIENLLHKKYLLPLENYTARDLMKLFT